jgi:hypothetical protein
LVPRHNMRRELSVLLNGMYCGFSWRPPRRPAVAGRLVSLACVLVLAFGISSGPASAYPCKPSDPPSVASGARTLVGRVETQQKDCDPEPSRPTRRGNADPMSFMFFIGIVVAVVFLPAALVRRENLPPQ